MALVASRLSLLARPSDSVIPTVPGLRCWLRADRIGAGQGASVSRWDDLSGFGNHAVQDGARPVPTLDQTSLIDNKPALIFNGASSNAHGLQAPLGQYVSGNDVPYTMIFVVRLLAADTGNLFLWGFDADPDAFMDFEKSTTGGNIRLTRNDNGGVSAAGSVATMPNSTSLVYSHRFGASAALQELFQDGVSDGSTTHNVGTMSVTRCQIGGYDTYSANMALAELAFFNRALTDTERLYVERDMGARYGISVA
jgi:hypothetical protein